MRLACFTPPCFLPQHAMDKNCCGGGEACGFVYCLGQDQCTQPWMMDDFATACAAGNLAMTLRSET